MNFSLLLPSVLPFLGIGIPNASWFIGQWKRGVKASEVGLLFSAIDSVFSRIASPTTLSLVKFCLGGTSYAPMGNAYRTLGIKDFRVLSKAHQSTKSSHSTAAVGAVLVRRTLSTTLKQNTRPWWRASTLYASATTDQYAGSILPPIILVKPLVNSSKITPNLV